MKLWNITLAPWILADGNYERFASGQLAEFALEFWTDALTNSTCRQPACEPQGHGYDVNAEVTTRYEDAWVIDFGLRAYRNEAPLVKTRAGEFVSGRIEIGVDPFHYFAELSERPEMPPLVYSWRVARIVLVATPLVRVRTGLFRRQWVPDQSKREEHDVEATDSPNPVNLQYLLDVPPKRESTTANWHPSQCGEP